MNEKPAIEHIATELQEIEKGLNMDALIRLQNLAIWASRAVSTLKEGQQ